MVTLTIYDYLRNTQEYNFIYIALGAKINIPGTNAEYQMLPGFIRDKLTQRERVLVILIDDYEKDYDDLNKHFLRQTQQLYNSLTIQIINSSNSITATNTEEMAQSVLQITKTSIDLLREKDVPLDRWMICNYISFKNLGSHNIEDVFHSKMQNKISRLMNDDRYVLFRNNIYMWCGYYKFFTNMIASYNEYIWWNATLPNINFFLNDNNASIPITNSELHYILEKVNENKKRIRIPILIDITETLMNGGAKKRHIRRRKKTQIRKRSQNRRTIKRVCKL